MSTHNICFCGEIKKNQYFWIEKSALTSAMNRVISKQKCIDYIEK